MPKSLPVFSKPDALELFTDRSQEQATLENILNPASSSLTQPALLVSAFYGVGGVGKTTLCRRALKIADEKFKEDLKCIYIDFDEPRWTPDSSFAKVSAEICNVLHRSGVSPELTPGLLAIWSQMGGGELSAAGLDDKWQLALDVVDKGSELVGIPGVSLLVRCALKLHKNNKDKSLQRRLVDLELWPTERQGRITQADIESKLPAALFYDLFSWLELNPELHLRLFVDGFERLQGRRNARDAQEGLAEFIGYFASPSKNDVNARARFLIFGREMLRWDELYEDKGWRDCWTQHVLGGLAEKDARDFLKKAAAWRRVKGHESIAQAIESLENKILDAADEHSRDQRVFYPYYLDLAIETIDRAKGSMPDLGTAPAELQERFLRYLEPNEQRALMILALAETFDESLFDWLAERRLIEYPVNSFHTALRKGCSYFQRTSERDSNWKFHRKMEEALQAKWLKSDETKAEARRIVRLLLQYHGESIGTWMPAEWTQREFDHWTRGVEIVVTQGFEMHVLPPEEALECFSVSPWRNEHPSTLSPRIEFLRRSLAGLEVTLGNIHPSVLALRHQQVVCLEESGEWETAATECLRVLEAREKVLGAGHRDVLASLNMLTHLEIFRGNFSRARELGLRAVAESEKHLGESDEETLMACHNMGSVLSDLDFREESEAYYRRAVEGRTKLFGEDNEATLRTLNNLANLIHERGDLDAAERLHRKILHDKTRALGALHGSTLRSAHNLAEVLVEKGELPGAEDLYRRALEGGVQSRGPGHRETLLSVTRLSCLYADELRDLKGAQAICEEHLGRITSQHGADHHSRYEIFCELARIHELKGDLTTAEDILSRALRGRQECLGESHPLTLETADSLAQFLAGARRFNDAKSLYENVIAKMADTRGELHPDTLSSKSRLARMLHYRAKQYPDAEKLYVEIRTTCEKEFGPEHPRTLDVLDDLGCLYRDMGRLDEAEEFFRSAIKGLDKALSPDNSQTIQSQLNLARLLFKSRGDHSQALTIFLDVYEKRKAALGAEHKFTLSALNLVGDVLLDKGDHHAAEEHYRQALTALEQKLDPSHPAVLACLRRLARVYKLHTGDFDRAEGIYNQVIKELTHVHGANSAEVMDAVDDLADCMEEKGDFAEAERLYRRAVNGFETARGPDHQETLACKVRLARLLKDRCNKLEDAQQLFQEIHVSRQKLLGDGHPETLDTLDDLADLFERKNDLVRAQEVYRQAINGLTATLGKNHSTTVSCQDRLAHLLYNKLQDLEGAELLYRSSVNARMELLGESHWKTLQTICNLAAVLADKGETDKAHKLLEDAAEAITRDSRAPSRDYLAARDRLAVLLEVKVNKLWEAGELYEATLKEYDDFLGPHHHETIRCRLNYATLLEKRGEPTRAQELYRELAAQTEFAEKRAPGLLASISWCLMDAENPTEEDIAIALSLSDAAVQQAFDDRSSILDTHARALFENGRVAEAVKTQREAVSQAPDEPSYLERLRRYEAAHNGSQL